MPKTSPVDGMEKKEKKGKKEKELGHWCVTLRSGKILRMLANGDGVHTMRLEFIPS